MLEGRDPELAWLTGRLKALARHEPFAAVVRGELLGDRLAQTAYCELRSGVRRLPPPSSMCRDRGSADESTTPALADHLASRRLVAMEYAPEVHLHCQLPLFSGRLQQRSGYGDARVCHHDIQGAEVLDMVSNRHLDAVCISHVHGQAESRPGAGEIDDQRLHLIV